jgi:hypothetical protein
MENSIARLLDLDTLYESGWMEFCGPDALSPEQMLMLAVLEDAIRCIQKYPRTPRSSACREAIDWVLAQEDDALFSFANICAVLGLDADYMREGLLTWKGKQAVKRRRHPAEPIRAAIMPPL